MKKLFILFAIIFVFAGLAAAGCADYPELPELDAEIEQQIINDLF